MFFRTASECRDFAKLLAYDARPSENQLTRLDANTEAVRIVFADRRRSSYALARNFASWFGTFGQCVLWITEYGIWPSSENMHLYYRLRNSYGDHRLLAEAPGHLFLSHENNELVTFLDFTIQFGWGAFLLGTGASVDITISHDEWIVIQSKSSLRAVVDDAARLSLACEQLRAPPALNA
jgi:hypothetical protein